MTTAPPTGDTATLRERAVRAVARRGRGLTIANLIAQGAIIVTGGVVRLTDSGLGCSTAPLCEPDSFFPDLTDLSARTAIEFGNRVMSPILLLIALALAIAVWRNRPHLRWWGLVPLVGVVVQAVLGVITVRVQLHPLVVAPHLLISLGLVWVSAYLALRYRNAPRRAGRCLKKPLRVSIFLLCAVAIMGAITTGAGPHSGDQELAERLDIDPDLAAQAHAMTVWAYVAVLAWIIWKVRRDRSEGARDLVRPAWVVLAVVTLAQGGIGYAQYFTGLPEILVGLHLLGAAVLVAAHSAFAYLLRRERPHSATAPVAFTSPVAATSQSDH